MELEKLRLRPRQHAGVRRGGISGFAGGMDSVRRIVRTNKFGVTEIRLATCAVCSVEVCDSSGCNKSRYEDFVRQLVEPVEDDKKDGAAEGGDEDEERKLKEENRKEVIKSLKGQAMKMKQAKKDQLNRRLKKKAAD